MSLLKCTNLFVATTEDCVSISAFDYWSIGHLFWGIFIFLLLYTFFNTPGNPNKNPKLSLWQCEIVTIIIAVAWEVIENTLVYWIGVKVKLDSPLNIFTDIVIWAIGGLGCWYFTHLMFVKKDTVLAYYLYGVLILALWIILFIVLGNLTKLNL